MSVVWRSGCLLVLLAAQLGALNPTNPTHCKDVVLCSWRYSVYKCVLFCLWSLPIAIIGRVVWLNITATPPIICALCVVIPNHRV